MGAVGLERTPVMVVVLDDMGLCVTVGVLNDVGLLGRVCDGGVWCWMVLRRVASG